MRSVHRANERRGTTTVEFAVVLPVILIVFMGSIEMTNLNTLRNMANDAAFQAARQGIVPGTSTAEAKTVAEDFLDDMGVLSYTVNVDDSSQQITATVQVPIDANSYGLGQFIGGKVITQQCALTKELQGD